MLSIRRIGVIGRTYRHLSRYQQILRVLFKYGFGDLVDVLNIDQYLEVGLQFVSRGRRDHLERLTRAERVRMAMEELGPTCVKLGQLLSTRPDLIPLEYLQEFAKLQDHVAPFPYQEVCEIVASELGTPPQEAFLRFEETPLAAASIGQVHRAQLMEGDEIVVKVQRPGIRRTVEVDLEIMFHLAGLAERHLEEVELQRPTRILEEFADSLAREIDYRIEASHVESFARQFMNDEAVYVPRVYREKTTERVLTMEYIPGIKASQADVLREKGYDLKEITRRGADLMMKQIFVNGLFHADPHPANIFILPHNVICYLDYGMVGRINRQEREDFAALILWLTRKDEKRAMEALLKLTEYDKEPERGRLEKDLTEFVDQFLFVALKEVRFGRLLQRLLEILTRHELRLKPALFLTMKAMSTVEGAGQMHDPDFEILPHAEPFVREVHLRRLEPQRIANDILDSGVELISLIKDIPGQLRAILKQTKEGKIRIEFEHRGLGPLLSTQDRSSNRIAFAIVLAALIVGSSLITLAELPPKWHGIPIIGLAGLLVAAVMGLWLLISIGRRGKL